MDKEIIEGLLHDGLISVHPSSPLRAFVGEQADRFYHRIVYWNLPYGFNSESPKDFFGELEDILRGSNWPSHWRHPSADLWKKVALHECVQYLALALGRHGFSLNPGEKTLLVFSNVLEHYSVAQVYNLIWRSAEHIAAFYLREKITKQHAANSVVGAIQRYGERARAENWSVKPYGRDFDCPQSVLSEVLFNAVLRVGDDGFKKCPDVSRLTVLPQFSSAATEARTASE